MYDYGRQCSPVFLDDPANITAMLVAIGESGLPTLTTHEVIGTMITFYFSVQLSASQVSTLMGIVSALDTYVYPVDVSMRRDGAGLVYADTENEVIKYIGTQSKEIHISRESQGHYVSIRAALLAHPDVDTVFIVHPGVYLENNPLPLNAGCVIRSAGNAENTIIVAQNATENILNIKWKCSIENITVRGATGATGIYMDGSGSMGQGRFAAVMCCFVQNCNIAAQSDGKNIHLLGGTADTLYMREVVVSTTVGGLMGFSVINGGTIISLGLTTFGLPPIGGNPAAPITYAYHVTGAQSKIAASTTNGYYCGVGLYLDNDAQSELSLLTLKYNGVGIVIGPNGTATRLSVNSLEIVGSVGDDIVNNAASGIVEVHSGVFDDTKLKNPGGARINAKYGTNKNGKTRQRMLGIINVGTPTEPGKMFIGEGQTDVFSFACLRNTNGESGTWSDVTSWSEENTPGTVFDLVHASAGACMYYGRDAVPVGLKIDITAPCVSGTIAWEYWNGSEWTLFDTMVTSSTAPFYQPTTLFLYTAGQYHVRFGLKSDSPLVTKTLNGVSKKWIRMRVVTALNVAPTSEYVVGHCNCVKFGSDGFTEYFGMSRPVKKLPWSGDDLRGSGAVGDQTLYIGTSLVSKRTRLLAGGVGRLGIQSVLPTDVDVSFPAKIVVVAVGSPLITIGLLGVEIVTPTSGNVTLTVKWATIAPGATVYTSTDDVPSTASGQGSVSVTKAVSNNVAVEFAFSIPMTNVNVNPNTGSIQNLWLSVERGSDTYIADVSIVTMSGWYVSSSDGVHLLAY